MSRLPYLHCLQETSVEPKAQPQLFQNWLAVFIYKTSTNKANKQVRESEKELEQQISSKQQNSQIISAKYLTPSQTICR